MNDPEKSASAHLPAARTWLRRGEMLGAALEALARGTSSALGRLLARVHGARARRAARRDLYRLDDRLLRDIGLRRDQVAELVDSMYRGTAVDALGSSLRSGVVAGVEGIAKAAVGNDAEYRSAA